MAIIYTGTAAYITLLQMEFKKDTATITSKIRSKFRSPLYCAGDDDVMLPMNRPGFESSVTMVNPYPSMSGQRYRRHNRGLYGCSSEVSEKKT